MLGGRLVLGSWVDILKLNGEDFKGTISHQDAIKLIFVAALGFSPQEFAGAVQ